MEKLKFITLAILVVLLTSLLFLKSCEMKKIEKKLLENIFPDTVFVSKPYKIIEIQTKYIEKPVLINVFKKDTSLRSKLEKSDIITKVHYKKNNFFQKLDLIKIDKIDSLGNPFSLEYKLSPIKELTIDHRGNLQTRKQKKMGLKILTTSIIIGTSIFVINQQNQ